MRAARACPGGAALRPAASDEPCQRSGGHGGVTQADAGGQRPAPPADPSERPGAPSVSRSTASGRAGGGMPESRRLGAGEAGSRHRRRGCPPPAPRRRDPERCARPHSGIPRFTWSGEGAGGSPERAGWQEGAASALPHLGGSERPRVTAPHLAGPPLAPTSLPGAGRRVGGGRRSLGPREADSEKRTPGSLASLLSAG